MISFSVNGNDSYALFGDYNASQVVNGEKGLYDLKTFAYLPEFAAAHARAAQFLTPGGQNAKE